MLGDRYLVSTGRVPGQKAGRSLLSEVSDVSGLLGKELFDTVNAHNFRNQVQFLPRIGKVGLQAAELASAAYN